MPVDYGDPLKNQNTLWARNTVIINTDNTDDYVSNTQTYTNSWCVQKVWSMLFV